MDINHVNQFAVKPKHLNVPLYATQANAKVISKQFRVNVLCNVHKKPCVCLHVSEEEIYRNVCTHIEEIVYLLSIIYPDPY